MSVFVGCPQNGNYFSDQVRERTIGDAYNENGVSLGHEEILTNPFSYESATKFGDSGPRTVRNGHPWAPARNYARGSQVVIYTPGEVRNNYLGRPWTYVSQGYPFPYSWSPRSGHFAHVPESAQNLFTDGIFNVAHLSANSFARLDVGLLQKAGYRRVNIGNNIGELGETIKMLAETVKVLVSAYKAARKGDWTKVAKNLKVERLHLPKLRTVSEIWLAYIYGWKPLMQDIYDLWVLIRDGIATKPLLIRVGRKVTDRVEYEDSSSSVANGTFFTKRRVVSDVHMNAQLWFTVSNTQISFWNSLGLVSPTEVIWEIMPFSFVVDWFLPVSSYLEAVSARWNIEFHDGHYGIKVDSTCTMSDVDLISFGLETTSSTCEARLSTSCYRRTPMSGLPIPLPFFKSPWGTIHVTNAIALIATLGHGRKG